MDLAAHSTSHRVRPLAAVRAIAALLEDPDDTAQFFAFVESLSGRQPLRLLARLRGSPEGAALLTRRPRLVDLLSDRAALGALPEGSLGRAYLAFMEKAGIDAAGLVAASERVLHAGRPDDLAWVGDRLRDSHDLWHVVTGYGPDLVGEAGVLAFSFAQTHSPGIGAFLLVVISRRLPGATSLIADALVRGSRAAWLPAVAWEDMLALPLDDVRRRLRVGPPPAYAVITSDELRARGLLPARRTAAAA